METSYKFPNSVVPYTANTESDTLAEKVEIRLKSQNNVEYWIILDMDTV